MKQKNTIWHPYTQHAISPESMHIDRAAGAYLFARDEEKKSERQIIDAISSWWVITHGHCHPDIVRAVREQATNLDQVIFAGFTHDPAEELAERLIGLTGERLQHIFYSDSGSTSIEVALKMAIGYWQHINYPRQKIIALENGYHGDTFGAMSTAARSTYNKIYENYLFDVEHIPVPVKGQEAISFEALEDVIKRNKDDVAAFVFEPLVQGAGGMVMYSPDALKGLVDICRAHNVLLIADEVMTGFGRTGSFFACDQAEFTPDIMCLSKGITGGNLPMGATLCSKEIYDAFYHEDKAKMFFHSTSFMGNPLSCAAANASLKIWAEEDVQGQIDSIALSHASVSERFSKRQEIENIRLKGAILAMDVKDNSAGTGYLSTLQPKLYDAFLSENVLIRPLGNSVYILPPYCVTQDDLNFIYDAINSALDKVL